MGNTELLSTPGRGIGPHLRVRGKFHGFSRVEVGTWGIFSSYGRDGPSKLVSVQRRQDSRLVTRDTSGISASLGRTTGMLLEVRCETKFPFPFSTVILAFLSIFKRSQASSPFEALNSTFLSRCQRDVRPPFQMVQGPRTLCRVPKGDSDIPSSCEIKDEPAIKPLQGNQAFFRFRASWCPFHLR